MKKLTISQFKVDSHIPGSLAVSAGALLDKHLGENLQGATIELSPGSTPAHCYWQAGERWGMVDVEGRLTEYRDGQHVPF